MYPLAAGFYAPHNRWYVAARSAEVTRAPLERFILNEPVVFYRTASGAPVALAARWPRNLRRPRRPMRRRHPPRR